MVIEGAAIAGGSARVVSFFGGIADPAAAAEADAPAVVIGDFAVGGIMGGIISGSGFAATEGFELHLLIRSSVLVIRMFISSAHFPSLYISLSSARDCFTVVQLISRLIYKGTP